MHYHTQIPFHLGLLNVLTVRWPYIPRDSLGSEAQIPAWVSAATCWPQGRTPALCSRWRSPIKQALEPKQESKLFPKPPWSVGQKGGGDWGAEQVEATRDCAQLHRLLQTFQTKVLSHSTANLESQAKKEGTVRTSRFAKGF